MKPRFLRSQEWHANRSGPDMRNLLQDLNYAWRGFLRTPGFTCAALLTLALGTGANATVFSFVNALLLRPAGGVADPDRLAAVFTSDFSSGPYGDSSYPDYVSLRDEATAFDGLAAYEEGNAGLLKDGDTVERVRFAAVSAPFFGVVGAPAAQGRLIGQQDHTPSAAPVAVISHRLWQRVFAGDPSVVGRTIRLDERAIAIAGIADEEFEGMSLGAATDVWVPLDASAVMDRGRRRFSIVGRLARGASLAQASVQVAAIADRLGHAYPETNRGTLTSPDRPRAMAVARHTRLHPSFREGDARLISVILLAAVLVVLLAACANVANLLLARASARGREMAIRLALGARRRRLVSQLLVESTALGLAGGALGLMVALWTAEALPSFFPAEQARLLDATVDLTVLAYTAAVTFMASLVFGCAPALHALKPSPAAVLRGDAGRVSDPRGGSFLRNALVAAQVALAMVLLVSAGLLVRSVNRALSADLGFGTRDAVLATVELPAGRAEEQGQQYFLDAADRIQELPGVAAAALVRTLPLSRASRRGFVMDGYQPVAGEDTEFPINVAGARYFETMQVPLLAGRTFDATDRAGAPRVAVVNELLASRYYSGRAVGRRLTDSRGIELTIVGVVASGKYLTVQGPEVPVVVYPLAQSYMPRMTVVARTAGKAEELVEAVRRALTDIDRDAAVFRVVSLEAHLSEALGGDRLTATLVASCGVLALTLALVGLSSVVSYGVGRRRREIGVRIALGARPLQILRLVLSEGATALLVGLVVGAAAAAGAARLLQSMLFGVGPSDPLTFTVVACALGLVALLAAAVPAHKALRVDPVTTLRQEG